MRLKCTMCDHILTHSETPESHLEVCGGMNDEDAERMSLEDLDLMFEEIEEDDNDLILPGE